ncbi:hypothetical protein HF669_11655 [Acidithiobacillus thiooxidans]|uniref:hypothetical protein n=1 Tax=Acidithiobacillus TaxID=119977 RepID=UPI0002624B1C|nr:MULTISPECIES: hypothetical protein [Acidithiobacillus]MBU2740251.1 hypothetical protein [Acidithiobacillus albertensis]MBU2812000.1 hypothetical protein [Acidithiobacillus thiooxidans]
MTDIRVRTYTLRPIEFVNCVDFDAETQNFVRPFILVRSDYQMHKLRETLADYFLIVSGKLAGTVVTYGPINIRKNDMLETYNALIPLKPERGQEILELSESHLYEKARKHGVKIIPGQSVLPEAQQFA